MVMHSATYGLLADAAHPTYARALDAPERLSVQAYRAHIWQYGATFKAEVHSESGRILYATGPHATREVAARDLATDMIPLAY